MIIAVSYTHLDVYKRQPTSSKVSLDNLFQLMKMQSSKLDAKFNKLEAKFDDKFHQQNARFDNFNNKFNRFDEKVRKENS